MPSQRRVREAPEPSLRPVRCPPKTPAVSRRRDEPAADLSKTATREEYMHNNDEAELRAQVRSEVKTDKLPELLQYLPNIANLAQDIDGLAHKIRGVPTALLNHALDGLAHDIKKLQASTRESLDALAEPSKVTAKNLESLGRGTGDRRQLHRTTKRQL